VTPARYIAPMGRPRSNPPKPTGRDVVPGFASMLRAAREARGWSAQKLADAAGVSLNTVWAIEGETRAPSLRVASALVAALGLAVMLHDPAHPVGPQTQR
jgi:ribosome-binding protein aMBF1 (putative translation factor)